ncbi:hypothetical protein ACFLVK_02050 [Chloroflexota bacterium]
MIVDHFLVWWLRSGRYSWSRLRRRLFEQRYLKVALPGVNTLDEIQGYLTQVTWTMDGPLHLFDSISYPQTVWARKKDDCDGFAILAATLLQQCEPDYRPVLLTAMVRPVSNSHTVCAFSVTSGELWFFDNASVRQTHFQTYDEIVAEIKGNYRLVCWDTVDPNTLQTIEFRKA